MDVPVDGVVPTVPAPAVAGVPVPVVPVVCAHAQLPATASPSTIVLIVRMISPVGHHNRPSC